MLLIENEIIINTFSGEIHPPRVFSYFQMTLMMSKKTQSVLHGHLCKMNWSSHPDDIALRQPCPIFEADNKKSQNKHWYNNFNVNDLRSSVMLLDYLIKYIDQDR